MTAPGRQETASQRAQPPSFGGRGGACGNNFPIDAMGLGKF
jgi:hypothetical protein